MRTSEAISERGWTQEELSRIGEATELRLQSFRADGTLRRPVTVWVVRVGDDLVIRSGYGRASAWWRGTQTRGRGRISAGGLDREVAFVVADDELAGMASEAYRTKYRAYGQVSIGPMTSRAAADATLILVPVT